MAWVTPTVFVSGNVLTAAQMNIISGDLNESAPAKFTVAGQLFVSTGANVGAARTPAFAFIATNETTASTTFVDLTTAGPSVTVTTGTTALVMVSSDMSSNTAGAFAQTGYAISGATTLASSLDRATSIRTPIANYGMNATLAVYQTALTAGSNTFKAQYTTSSGGGTAAFQNRRISVIPL